MPQPPARPQRICVLRLSALGDVVLAVPAVRALARAWPGTQISWVTSPAFVPVLRGLPGNVELLPLTKPGSLGDYRALRRYWTEQPPFDLLLAMQASLRANLIYPLIRAPLKIGFDAPQARDLQGWFVNRRIAPGERHLLDGFMAFAAAAGVSDTRVEWGLRLDDDACQWVRDVTAARPYILLNPSASKPERNWPFERNVAFAREVQLRHGLPVVICSGPGDRERATAGALAREVPGSVNLAGQTDLPRLFALIAGARVLVSPDSGPVHIARAFEVPVVGLYASARPQKTGPYRQLQWTVDRYPDAVRELLGKNPAAVDWDTRMRDARAMQLITVDEVLGKTAAALSARR